jgi:hypothetical protein
MNTQRRDGRKKNSAGGGKTAPSIFYRQIRPQPYQPRKPRTLASPDRAAPSIRMKGDSKSTSIAQPFHKKNKKKQKVNGFRLSLHKQKTHVESAELKSKSEA